MKDDVPSSLFHYTTAAGLLGIVKGLKLWATDVRFMNDEQDGVYAQRLFEKALREMPSPTLDPDHWAYQGGEGVDRTFTRFLDYAIDELNSAKFGIYVACFCEEGDLLSQWRAYGSDHGYAIEFSAKNVEGMLQHLPVYPPGSGLRRVRYGAPAAEPVIDEARTAVAAFNLNHPGVKAHFAALHFSSMLATVKHPGFSEEREWRAVIATEGLWQPSGGQVSPAQLRFRASSVAIVPYLELSLQREAILGVRIGPGRNADARERGVTKLLEAVGLETAVTKSDVPLRT